MNKLVVIELEKGNLNDGFPSVIVKFWDQNSRPMQFHASLPPAPEVAELYKRFQLIYQAIYHQRISRSLIEVDAEGLNNVSEVEFSEVQQELDQAINSWLNSNSFRPIDQQLRARLALNEEFQVIFETSDRWLRYLPWHLWHFIEEYRSSEVGLSYPRYEPVKPSSHNTTDKVRILAILGSSDGINIQEDKIVLEQLPNSSTSFLVEPSRQELDNQLWEKRGWDILFFAGHSHSQTEHGQIQINQNSSLTITELRNALKYAIKRGLKQAILNSCDGLGLAQELADLQIPQIIVMRHDVPDLVAQEFLKHFLKAFAEGESFYLAVRYARERLQGLEERFPGASWLPVICQNPAEDTPTWQTLRGHTHSIPVLPLVTQKLQTVLLLSVVITCLVMGVRSLGWMQQWELPAFDWMMRMRPAEEMDPRIVVITITEADIRAQNQKQKRSLSDQALDQVLQKLAPSKPRVIGLDIYRDFPADSQYPNLAVSLKKNNFITICKAGVDGNSPPPEVPKERLGFSDVVRDDDLIVRRHLLDMNPSNESSCPTRRSFSLQIASQYLEKQGIPSKITADKYYQLGSVVFKPLKNPTGSYQKFDDLGHQILLNYRSGGIAEQITLGQVLQGKFKPDLFKDKVVLIGTDALSTRDYLLTPYSQGTTPHKEVPGIIIQTEMVSQILSAVLDERPLLWFLPVWGEAIWIWSWSVIAGIVVLYCSQRLQFALFVAAILLARLSCTFYDKFC